MDKIDHDRFLFAVQGPFGALSESQRAGFARVLDFLEADRHVADFRWGAYMLATSWHETGKTMQPIAEYGKGKGRAYGVPHPKTALVYYGRGYTQNTWYDNYLMLTQAWNKAHPDRPVDFTLNPDLLLAPEYSYWAMSYGMRNGSYTGVGLARYFNGERSDPLNARKIINGLDCAERIAGYYGIILQALHDSAIPTKEVTV